jgi:hypothetical protein
MIPSYLSSSDPGEAAGPPRKSIFDLRSAESAAWKTLATILPRAGSLPALSSLLQHCIYGAHIFLCQKGAKGCYDGASQVPPGEEVI